MIEIYKEQPQDYKEVYEVVKKAFESAMHADGTEQDLVVSLRKSENFIPELSLVAKDGEKIVGHIMFTKLMIGDEVCLALAPLAVLPEYQKQKVGTKLIEKGHEIAKSLGYKVSVVLGSDLYYPKFGYVKASSMNIYFPGEVPDEYFMAVKLVDNVNVSGIVKYAKEFGIE